MFDEADTNKQFWNVINTMFAGRNPSRKTYLY
jgi:hypothetical protein